MGVWVRGSNFSVGGVGSVGRQNFGVGGVGRNFGVGRVGLRCFVLLSKVSKNLQESTCA